MTPPLYTTLYNEAINRREYHNVLPDEAISLLKEASLLPGTYLISRGEGFCELLFTFIYVDRKIYQLIAKMTFSENRYLWSFNTQAFLSIDDLICRSKLYSYCFLLFAYSPLMKIKGFVPLPLTHEPAYKFAKEGREGDYFVTEGKPGSIQIIRFSRERNAADIYSLKINEKNPIIPEKYLKKWKLNRAAGLT